MEQTTFEMPDGFTWVGYGVIKCERCKAQEDVVGVMRTAAPAFIAKHRACEVQPGLRLASSMTIREVVAMHLMAAMLTEHGPGQGKGWRTLSSRAAVEDAVYATDLLLDALHPPEEIDEDDFELVQEARGRPSA